MDIQVRNRNHAAHAHRFGGTTSEKNGGQSDDEDEVFQAPLRMDAEYSCWIGSRKSRCRIGLECNRGEHSRRQQTEPVRPGTLRGDRTTRCV
jgi:hypothetical protein